MPTTKKGNFYFGLMMCSGMVVGMTFYNLMTNGLIGTISLKGILLQLILGFITAFLLEVFVVGPVAKKIACSLPYDKSKKVFSILSISLCMVIGMVLFMSLFGLGMAYLSDSSIGGSFLESYFSIVLKNFIFALPLQLIIVGPLVRYIFTKFVLDKKLALTNT